MINTNNPIKEVKQTILEILSNEYPSLIHKCSSCNQLKADNDICFICPDSEIFPDELKDKEFCKECCFCADLPTKEQIEYIISWGLDY